MAQTKFSSNLSSAAFSFSPSFKGQSVIQGQLDQNYYQATAGFAGETAQRGIDIPQNYYCENTIPTGEGYRSIAYKYFVSPPAPEEDFVRVLPMFDGNGNSALIAYTADRKFFAVSQYTGGLWVPLPLPGGFTWSEATIVTSTTIWGSPVICIQGLGLFVYAIALNQFIAQPVTGVDATEIKGICATSGYLVLWDDLQIYWSSTVDAWDFVPSLITGAGSAQVEGLKGRIILCKEISQGFIIYTDILVMSAAYSANLASPWVIVPLQGSGGIRGVESVAGDANLLTQFAWTSGGILAIELHEAKPIFPELTDYVASGIAGFTSTLTSAPETEVIESEREVRIAIISSRYICVSVGILGEADLATFPIPVFQESFVWDLQLKRWGKLNVTHAQLFEAPFTATPPVFF